MKRCTKQGLYIVANTLREQYFYQMPEDPPYSFLDFCLETDLFSFEQVPFRTDALRGIAVIAQEEHEQDILLINRSLSRIESNFYCAHEMMHLFLHRDRKGQTFHCYEQVQDKQDFYLEWQANEGAAELLVPYRKLFPIVAQAMPEFCTWMDINIFRTKLAQQFQVTQAVMDRRLESLAYEIQQYIRGVPIDRIEFLSAREQRIRGLNAQSLIDLENRLQYEELH